MSLRPAVATWVLVGLVAVAAVVGGLLLLRSDGDAPAPVDAPALSSLAPDASSAEDYAGAACVRVRLVEQGIRADSAASVVRQELASARVLAGAALRRDGRWTRLSGGVAALDEAVRLDDAATAVAALQVALAECRQVTAG